MHIYQQISVKIANRQQQIPKAMNQQTVQHSKQLKPFLQQQTSQTNDMSSIIYNEQFHSLDQSKLSQCLAPTPSIQPIRQPLLPKSSNLAYVLAERMSPSISKQVVQIVDYYEAHMHSQISQIHRLVETNNRLRKIVEQKQAQQDKDQGGQENRDYNIQGKVMQNIKEKDEDRVRELESNVMEKNKQIASLNQQITQLIIKVKKYKKRVIQLQAKSPIKMGDGR